MLANKDIDLKGLATLKAVKIGERNVVGLRLPSLVEIEVDVARYGYLVRPHWVDLVAERLKEVLRLKVEAQVTQRQVALLDAAVPKVTQRVNLFDRNRSESGVQCDVQHHRWWAGRRGWSGQATVQCSRKRIRCR